MPPRGRSHASSQTIWRILYKTKPLWLSALRERVYPSEPSESALKPLQSRLDAIECAAELSPAHPASLAPSPSLCSPICSCSCRRPTRPPNESPRRGASRPTFKERITRPTPPRSFVDLNRLVLVRAEVNTAMRSMLVNLGAELQHALTVLRSSLNQRQWEQSVRGRTSAVLDPAGVSSSDAARSIGIIRRIIRRIIRKKSKNITRHTHLTRLCVRVRENSREKTRHHVRTDTNS